MGFELNYPLSSVKPAEYNPRSISPEELEELSLSLKTIGFVKPIVVREDGRLIAGHQRTRTAIFQGCATAPAYVVGLGATADEIRFNQLHNGSEVDVSAESATVPYGAAGEWKEINPLDVRGELRAKSRAAERQEILRLLAKHGPFSAVVATPDGSVLTGAHYASACRILGVPVLVRYVEASQAESVLRFLGKPYGRYSYAHLPKTTWAQSLAQMQRLAGAQQLKSTLYEHVVIPRLAPGARVLDFGAGTGAYARELRSRGVEILGLEFYRRRGMAIDVNAVQRDITAVLASVEHRGRFDAVVCDSVLNSVDTLLAEADVLATINAFTRPGGWIFASGRSLQKTLSRANHSQAADHRRYVEFLDDDGFSALYRRGVWHYQKFHHLQQVKELAASYIGPEVAITTGERCTVPKDRLTGLTWQVAGRKAHEVDWRSGVEREFNLPTPNGRYGRDADAVRVLFGAIEREAATCSA